MNQKEWFPPNGVNFLNSHVSKMVDGKISVVYELSEIGLLSLHMSLESIARLRKSLDEAEKLLSPH